MKNYKVIKTSPIDSVIKINELKNYLRINHNDDDEMLRFILGASLEYAEEFTRITFREKLIEFNCTSKLDKLINLPFVPVKSIDRISKVSSKDKEIDIDHCKIHSSKASIYFPKLPYNTKIKVTYTAHYMSYIDILPDQIKQGIFSHAAKIYDQQENSNSLEDLICVYQTYRRLFI